MSESPIHRLVTWRRSLDRALGLVLSIAMSLAVLIVLWQVAGRYLLRQPSSFTDELVRYLLVWIGLLGGAQAAGRRLHLAIELLPGRLSGSRRHCLAAFNQLLIGAFSLSVLVYGGVGLTRLTLRLGQTSAALGLPLGWVYAILPISGLILTFYSALFAWDHLRQARGEPTAFEEPALTEDAR